MAPGGTSVRVTGVDELEAGLSRADAALSDWRAINQSAAETLARAGARYAPRRTGHLAGSHHPLATATTAAVEVTAAYAGPIRYGVGPRVGMRGPHNIAPQDWLGDAVDQAGPEIESLYAAEVSNIVQDIP